LLHSVRFTIWQIKRNYLDLNVGVFSLDFVTNLFEICLSPWNKSHIKAISGQLVSIFFANTFRSTSNQSPFPWAEESWKSRLVLSVQVVIRLKQIVGRHSALVEPDSKDASLNRLH
jgi:hypothetical protein